MKKFIVSAYQLSVLMLLMAVVIGCDDSETGECDSSAQGNWVQAMHTGCKYQTNEPFTWSGKCVDGFAHGEGTIQWYDEDGHQRHSKYIGNVTCGKNDGYGEYYAADGSSYKGEWSNDLIHGSGVYVNANGERYEGQFAYGEPVGYAQAEEASDNSDDSVSSACPVDISSTLQRLHSSSSFAMYEAIEYTKIFVMPKLSDDRCEREKQQVCSRLNSIWDYYIRLNAAEQDSFSGFTVTACKAVCSMQPEENRASCEAECDEKERERIRSLTSQKDENHAEKERFMNEYCE